MLNKLDIIGHVLSDYHKDTNFMNLVQLIAQSIMSYLHGETEEIRKHTISSIITISMKPLASVAFLYTGNRTQHRP